VGGAPRPPPPPRHFPDKHIDYECDSIVYLQMDNEFEQGDNCKRFAELTARLSAAERENERLREVATEDREKWSWDALVWMATRMLDENYRADVFTGESGEPGPVFVMRMRHALSELGHALAALTPPTVATTPEEE
jgi:hypothetical protein